MRIPLLRIVVCALGAVGIYRLVKTIPIPGSGSADYLASDSGNRRLYVSHGSKVDVIDLDTGTLAASITGLNGVHGIAIANDLKRGFISDGLAGQITIFDLNTLAIVGSVKAGSNPDGIVYDVFSQRVFAFNAGSKDMTAIDADSGYVEGTIPLGGKPEFAATDGKGYVYANITDANELVRVDAKTLEVKNHWPLGPCESPLGLSIDPVKRRLFSMCENKNMVVMDADGGNVITTVPIGAGADAAAFDPETKLVFSSNGEDGTLTVIKQDSADQYRVLETVRTQRGARTLALDLRTHSVYLPDAASGTLKLLIVAR